MNHPILSQPNATTLGQTTVTLNATNFGKTTLASGERIMQFAFKYTF